MAQVFIKVLKWAISVSFFILGVYCLRTTAETGDIKPLAFVIIGFGFVYWFSRSTYEASKMIFIKGLAVVIAMWVVTNLIYMAGFEANSASFGFYTAWWLLSLFIGVPVMAHAFWNDD